ncbi:MAG: asparaginase [Pseudomonadota bacterium]
MTQPLNMVEIWRGPILESQHMGHAVVCDTSGHVVDAWGDAELVMLPRSSAKMLQALPLVESGAAAAYGLDDADLALACASHNAAAIHTDRVTAWLKTLDLSDEAFRCGPQEPADQAAREDLIKAGKTPCQHHNECSGKHAGFLTVTKYLDAGAEYVDVDHPVQKAVLEAHEDLTGATSAGFGVDGCSAPNFATPLVGLARAMARMARGDDGTGRGKAAARLVQAMARFPELVAGEGRACTELMRAMDHRVAVKTGAEAVFVAILPDQKLGIAVKISDGGVRAAQCMITALLVKYGALRADHPVAQKYMYGPITNRRGLITGGLRPSAPFDPAR